MKSHSIQITPAMRKSVLTEGQPLFKPTASTPSLSQEEISGLVKDVERLIPGGSKVTLSPTLEVDLAENKEAAAAWSLGEEGVIKLAGDYRTAYLDNGEFFGLIRLSLSDMRAATPGHEMFHLYKKLGLIHDDEVRWLDSVIPGKDGVSAEERQADDFGEWMAGKRKAPIPSRLKKIYLKFKNFLLKLRSALAGKGFKTLEDFYEKIYSGEIKKRHERKAGQQESFEGEVKFSPADKEEQLDLYNQPSPYEVNKDYWFGNKDVAILKNSNEAANLQDEIKASVGEEKYRQKSKDLDQAIQIYIDSKRAPEHAKRFYNNLTEEQRRIVDLSQNLTDDQKAIADKIAKSYRETGLRAKDFGVIRNVLDNYAARTWRQSKTSKRMETENLRKFGTTTRHAKHRTFETIIEGWASGKELAISGATNNLNSLKDEIARTIEDKKLLETLSKTKDKFGDPLISDKRLEGYERIEHPNFTKWVFRKNIAMEDVQGRNFFTTKEGDVFERMPMYAPKAMAEDLNNILGRSKLKGRLKVGGISLVDVATKYNAVFKSWILQTSLFHHLAFMRSYLLGTNNKTLKEWNMIPGSEKQAYRQGLRAIREMVPELEFLVHNGLTLQKTQDWEEAIMRYETTIFEELMDKTRATKAIKEKIRDLRQAQADFLFKSFGAGLKAQAALIEYRNALKRHPDMDPRERAKMVANLINDDFGGLHLGRIGRDPTTQHIFRLLALAPDWTESNIRSMVKMIGAGTNQERQLYRHFWASIAAKGISATIVGNLLLSLGDDDDALERFKKAWDAGHLKWLDIDITPVYKLLGGKTEARKYFSIVGHFKDPIKFATHPIVSAKHKGSVFMKGFFELFEGTNWQGKRFTTMNELLGVDDKGVYLTTTGKHKAGEMKGGKHAGKLVRWGRGRALSLEQIPSFTLSQIKGWQPVQVQNFMAWYAGEMEGFDAIGNSLGLGIRTTYPRPGMTDDEEQFSKISRDIREVTTRYKLLKKQGVLVESEMYLKANRKKIESERHLKRTLKVISRLKRARTRISKTRAYSENRRQELIELKDKEIGLAKEEFNRFYKGRPTPKKGSLLIPGAVASKPKIKKKKKTARELVGF